MENKPLPAPGCRPGGCPGSAAAGPRWAPGWTRTLSWCSSWLQCLRYNGLELENCCGNLSDTPELACKADMLTSTGYNNNNDVIMWSEHLMPKFKSANPRDTPEIQLHRWILFLINSRRRTTHFYNVADLTMRPAAEGTAPYPQLNN